MTEAVNKLKDEAEIIFTKLDKTVKTPTMWGVFIMLLTVCMAVVGFLYNSQIKMGDNIVSQIKATEEKADQYRTMMNEKVDEISNKLDIHVAKSPDGIHPPPKQNKRYLEH